jgi:hypothetical protein
VRVWGDDWTVTAQFRVEHDTHRADAAIMTRLEFAAAAGWAPAKRLAMLMREEARP